MDCEICGREIQNCYFEFGKFKQLCSGCANWLKNRKELMKEDK